MRAFKPFDLSPVIITPTKQNKISINPIDFNIFEDFKNSKCNPKL